eukprot:403357973
MLEYSTSLKLPEISKQDISLDQIQQKQMLPIISRNNNDYVQQNHFNTINHQQKILSPFIDSPTIKSKKLQLLDEAQNIQLIKNSLSNNYLLTGSQSVQPKRTLLFNHFQTPHKDLLDPKSDKFDMWSLIQHTDNQQFQQQQQLNIIRRRQSQQQYAGVLQQQIRDTKRQKANNQLNTLGYLQMDIYQEMELRNQRDQQKNYNGLNMENLKQKNQDKIVSRSSNRSQLYNYNNANQSQLNHYQNSRDISPDFLTKLEQRHKSQLQETKQNHRQMILENYLLQNQRMNMKSNLKLIYQNQEYHEQEQKKKQIAFEDVNFKEKRKNLREQYKSQIDQQIRVRDKIQREKMNRLNGGLSQIERSINRDKLQFIENNLLNL